MSQEVSFAAQGQLVQKIQTDEMQENQKSNQSTYRTELLAQNSIQEPQDNSDTKEEKQQTHYEEKSRIFLVNLIFNFIMFLLNLSLIISAIAALGLDTKCKRWNDGDSDIDNVEYETISWFIVYIVFDMLTQVLYLNESILFWLSSLYYLQHEKKQFKEALQCMRLISFILSLQLLNLDLCYHGLSREVFLDEIKIIFNVWIIRLRTISIEFQLSTGFLMDSILYSIHLYGSLQNNNEKILHSDSKIWKLYSFIILIINHQQKIYPLNAPIAIYHFYLLIHLLFLKQKQLKSSELIIKIVSLYLIDEINIFFKAIYISVIIEFQYIILTLINQLSQQQVRDNQFSNANLNFVKHNKSIRAKCTTT